MVNPWMNTVIVSGPAKQLLALVAALDPAWNNTPRAVTYLQLQLDVGAGNVHLYVGNADVSSTNRGIELTAGQAGPNSLTVFGNPISLANVYLLTSSEQTEVEVNVTIVQA